MAGFLDLFSLFFKPRPVKAMGDQLYAACVAQARHPRFYTDYGVKDEIGARFELLTLHVVMTVSVLKSMATEQGDETAQALFDAFLLALDTTLREQGVGDLTVPKKMKTIGKVVYTRLDRWVTLWKEGAAVDAQLDYVVSTLYADDEDTAVTEVCPAKAQALTAYIALARASLVAEDLLKGHAAWPEPANVPATVNDAQETA